jgi:hypothetical protein
MFVSRCCRNPAFSRTCPLFAVTGPAADIADPKREHGEPRRQRAVVIGNDSTMAVVAPTRAMSHSAGTVAAMMAEPVLTTNSAVRRNFGWAAPAVDRAIMSTGLSQITRWRG